MLLQTPVSKMHCSLDSELLLNYCWLLLKLAEIILNFLKKTGLSSSTFGQQGATKYNLEEIKKMALLELYLTNIEIFERFFSLTPVGLHIV